MKGLVLVEEMHEGFWSSDGVNVGIAGRTLLCDDVLLGTCRLDRMGRNAVAVVADALAAQGHDPLSCHGSSAGPASRKTPGGKWRSLRVAPNRVWSSRGHYPESPLYVTKTWSTCLQDPDWTGRGVVVVIFM